METSKGNTSSPIQEEEMDGYTVAVIILAVWTFAWFAGVEIVSWLYKNRGFGTKRLGYVSKEELERNFGGKK